MLLTLSDQDVRLRFIHDMRQHLGIIRANLQLLTEGLSPADQAGAQSDCLEAAERALRMLDALAAAEDGEITQEVCAHLVKMAPKESRPPGSKSCECCRGPTFGKLCAACSQPPPFSTR